MRPVLPRESKPGARLAGELSLHLMPAVVRTESKTSKAALAVGSFLAERQGSISAGFSKDPADEISTQAACAAYAYAAWQEVLCGGAGAELLCEVVGACRLLRDRRARRGRHERSSCSRPACDADCGARASCARCSGGLCLPAAASQQPEEHRFARVLAAVVEKSGAGAAAAQARAASQQPSRRRPRCRRRKSDPPRWREFTDPSALAAALSFRRQGPSGRRPRLALLSRSATKD